MLERETYNIWTKPETRRYFLEDIHRLKGQRVLIDGDHIVEIRDSTADDRELLRLQEETQHEWGLLRRGRTKIPIEGDIDSCDPLPAIKILGGPIGVTFTHTHPKGEDLTFNPLERMTLLYLPVYRGCIPRLVHSEYPDLSLTLISFKFGSNKS